MASRLNNTPDIVPAKKARIRLRNINLKITLNKAEIYELENERRHILYLHFKYGDDELARVFNIRKGAIALWRKKYGYAENVPRFEK